MCFVLLLRKKKSPEKFASGNPAHYFNVLMFMESYMQIDVPAELQSVILVEAYADIFLSVRGSILTVLACLRISCQNKLLFIPVLVKGRPGGITLC